MKLSSKMKTHRSITSSLRIRNLKNDKFGDISSEIDYNSKTDVLREVIYLIINQCELTPLMGDAGRQTLSVSCAAQASKARL